MLKSEIKQDFFSFFFLNYTLILVTLLGGASSKEPACQCRRHKRCWFCPWVGRIQWHPTPVFLPGESHGRRSLVGYSPWGRKESGTTERLHFHFSLLCIGEGNGNPLQYPAWRIPGTEEPSGLLWGSHRVEYDWSNIAAAVAVCIWGFPGGSAVKNPPQCKRHMRHEFSPWVRKIPWRRA